MKLYSPIRGPCTTPKILSGLIWCTVTYTHPQVDHFMQTSFGWSGSMNPINPQLKPSVYALNCSNWRVAQVVSSCLLMIYNVSMIETLSTMMCTLHGVGGILFCCMACLQRGFLIHKISWIWWEYISWWRADFYVKNNGTFISVPILGEEIWNFLGFCLHIFTPSILGVMGWSIYIIGNPCSCWVWCT